MRSYGPHIVSNTWPRIATGLQGMADGGIQPSQDVIERTPARARAGLAALYEQGHIAPKIKGVDPEQILTRYLGDERTADIAASLGVTRSGLNYWLLRHCADDWRDAQAARAITAMEQAKDAVDLAADALTLARAREQLRAAQWELERLLSRLYGQKQELTVHVGDWGDKLRKAKERVIEHTSDTAPDTVDAQVIEP